MIKTWGLRYSVGVWKNNCRLAFQVGQITDPALTNNSRQPYVLSGDWSVPINTSNRRMVRTGLRRRVVAEIYQMLKKREYHYGRDPLNYEGKIKTYRRFLERQKRKGETPKKRLTCIIDAGIFQRYVSGGRTSCSNLTRASIFRGECHRVAGGHGQIA
jgi:hypothetical protein